MAANKSHEAEAVDERWLPFLDAASWFLERPDFEWLERGYKLEVAESIAGIGEALQEDGDLAAAAKGALRHKENNLLAWRVVDNTFKWVKSDTETARQAIRPIFDESIEALEALAQFLAHLPLQVVSGAGTRLSVGSFLLMGRDAEQFPIFRPTPVKKIQDMADWQRIKKPTEVELYAEMLGMLESFRATANDSGLNITSPLHAQGVLYAIASWEPDENWPEDLKAEILRLRGDEMKNKAIGLEQALENYDRDAASEVIEAAVGQRNSFVALFPPDSLSSLELDQYALGQPEFDVTFSKQLEYEMDQCGLIGGGVASKHLIFYSRSQERWRHETKYRDVEHAWSTVRSGFVSLVELGAQGRFAEIDEIDSLFSANMVRGKVAWAYFPDQLLPIYSRDHIAFWMSIFKVDAEGKGPVGQNRLLFEALTEMEAFAGWTPLEIMHFLYSWTDPRPSYEIFKIAPGSQAELWSNCLDNGWIRLGWDALGDLTLFEDDDELRAGYQASYPEENKSTTTKNLRGLKTFRDLEAGDIIVANRGTKQIVGIGRVTNGYRYEHNLDSHKHVVGVDWFDTTERSVDFGSSWMPTIVEIKPEDYHRITNGGSGKVVVEPLPVVPVLHIEAEQLLERSGQLIFFGPPGTGKTYSARRHAAWLLEGGSANSEAARAFGVPSSLQTIEERYITAAQIDERPSWVLVANPSRWSFDQLFENGSENYDYGKLQRNYGQVELGDEIFGYEATPVKKVVATAQISRALYTDPATNKQYIDITPGARITKSVTWDDLKADPVLASSEPVSNNMQGTLFRLEPHEAARLRDMCGLGEPGANAVSVGVPQLTRVTFHPTYSYEDFIEGYKPTESGNGGLELEMRDGVFKRVCRAATADPERPYVLMIDEINRGNVPKIFGELITLIEKDKRGMSLTLPQSRQAFHVPNNVHIIATMNTADRSIHILDTALRRRFAFVELLPDASVLSGSVIGPMPLEDFLNELNARIRTLVGREKQIGHAVLMTQGAPIANAIEFAISFKYELLPLLQEYTYGNYGDLAELLGSEIIDENRQAPKQDTIDDPERLVAALATHLELS